MRVVGAFEGTANRIDFPDQADMKKQTEIKMSDKFEADDDKSLLLQPGRPKLKKPPMFKVILLNDDFTPMDFVIEVLQSYFHMDQEKATRVMLHVHTRGMGVCGVFTRDVAETKVVQVNEYSRLRQHPLLCSMEEA